MLNSEIHLRPHHSLCIQYFVGKGYSPNFTKHMTQTVDFLNKENPNIVICNSADDICVHCPNLLGGICLSECKVQKYDRKIAELLSLDANVKIKWKDLQTAVREKIIFKNKLSEVCGDCQWNEICVLQNQKIATGG